MPKPPHLALGLLLVSAVALGVWGAWQDSVTYDEPGHLVAGLSIWQRGDFRIDPAHPPLARLWLSAPLLLVRAGSPDFNSPAFASGDYLTLGATWLAAQEDPERAVRVARLAAIAILAGLVVLAYLAGCALWGAWGGVVAAALVALDPSFLAHGHLTTTDVPMALGFLAVPLAAAALSDGRLVRAGIALSVAVTVAALTKLFWLALLPALAAQLIWLAWLGPPSSVGTAGPARPPRHRWVLSLVGVALVAFAAAWVSTWLLYGARYRAAARDAPAPAAMYPAQDVDQPVPSSPEARWELVLHDPWTATRRRDLFTRALVFARDHRLAPEAYLYGAAYTQKKSLWRVAYLDGEYSETGWRRYFPEAWTLKTPLPAILLVALALAGAWRWRASAPGAASSRRRTALLVGLVTLAASSALLLVTSRFDIGFRHALPLQAVLYVLAGGVVVWGDWRAGRIALVGLLLALALETAVHAPDFVGYFNPLGGGTHGGWRRLADSNVDFGQDLGRLRSWQAARADATPLVLAAFGEAPLPRGLASAPLLPHGAVGPLAPLAPGWYALSVNTLLGLYYPGLRAETWRDPALRREYAELYARQGALNDAARARFDLFARALLVSRLSSRPPDERVGASLFLYHLDGADLARLLVP